MQASLLMLDALKTSLPLPRRFEASPRFKEAGDIKKMDENIDKIGLLKAPNGRTPQTFCLVFLWVTFLEGGLKKDEKGDANGLGRSKFSRSWELKRAQVYYG